MNNNIDYFQPRQSGSSTGVMLPEDLWLDEKHQQSAELKNDLLERSAERFANFLTLIGFGPKGPGNSILTLTASPSFVQGYLFDRRQASGLLNEIAAKSNLTAFKDKNTQRVSGGAVNIDGRVDYFSAFILALKKRPLEGFFNFLELNEHGLFVFRKSITKAGKPFISLFELINSIKLFNRATRLLYSHSQVNYSGFVDFRCDVGNIAGKRIDISHYQSGISSTIILENSLGVETEFPTGESDSATDSRLPHFLYPLIDQFGINADMVLGVKGRQG